MYEQVIINPITDRSDKTSIEDRLEAKYVGVQKCGMLYFELNGLQEYGAAYGMGQRTCFY